MKRFLNLDRFTLDELLRLFGAWVVFFVVIVATITLALRPNQNGVDKLYNLVFALLGFVFKGATERIREPKPETKETVEDK